MKTKYIGIYEIGWEKAELYSREGTGGEYWAIRKDTKCPQIFIGFDYNNYTELLSVLLHESTEFLLMRNNNRYIPSEDLSKDSSAFVFHMTHTEFSHVMASVADFLTGCQRDFYKAWKAYQKINKK